MGVNRKLMLQPKRKSAIEGDIDRPKKKSRKYNDQYLDFGFTFILQNGEEKPQCVICSKTLASESMLPNKLKEPGYDVFVLRFRPKTSSCQLPYQRPSFSTDCAEELFKSSNGSDSLLDCTRKNFFGWGLRIFCEWRHK